MTTGKQIEEMAKEILKCSCVGTCLECECATVSKDDYACIDVKIAEGLYNAGYRKASEVVRDIFNDLNEMWHKGRGFINYSDLVRLERLHEQKYTEACDGDWVY